MNIEKLEQGIGRVRDRATLTEQGGGTDGARGMRWAADEFESVLNEWFYEALTPTQAAEECHWKGSTIAKEIRKEEYEQAGTKGAPRVTRRVLFSGSNKNAVDQAVNEALGLED